MAHKNPFCLRQAVDSRVNHWIRQDYFGAIGTPLELAALLEKIDSDGPAAAPGGEPLARIGSRVRLLDLQTEETFVLELCKPEDARPEHGKISILSPLGARLLGQHRNGMAEVSLLRSQLQFVVVDIVEPAPRNQTQPSEPGPEQGL